MVCVAASYVGGPKFYSHSKLENGSAYLYTCRVIFLGVVRRASHRSRFRQRQRSVAACVSVPFMSSAMRLRECSHRVRTLTDWVSRCFKSAGLEYYTGLYGEMCFSRDAVTW